MDCWQPVQLCPRHPAQSFPQETLTEPIKGFDLMISTRIQKKIPVCINAMLTCPVNIVSM